MGYYFILDFIPYLIYIGSGLIGAVDIFICILPEKFSNQVCEFNISTGFNISYLQAEHAKSVRRHGFQARWKDTHKNLNIIV